MARFHFTISESNITVLVNGAMQQMPRKHMGYEKLKAHLKTNSHDAGYIESLFDKRDVIARLTSGNVKVVGTTVYYKGAPVRGRLSEKVVYMLDNGFDATPWAAFMDRIASNPNESAREMLYEFIERWNSPLDMDGRFIAFKGVRDNYKDCHTGTFDNSPGNTVEMPREGVVEDPNVTCAPGLHVCASHYLDSFWGNCKVIAVAVAPEDVVSVPVDYKYSKMRVCKYEVLGDVEDQRHRDRIETAQVIGKSEETGRVQEAERPQVTDMSVGKIVEDEDGLQFRTTDIWPEEGDRVVMGNRLGHLTECYEVDFRDERHPLHEDWQDGEVAGFDITDVFYFCVTFDDGEIFEGDFAEPEDIPVYQVEFIEDEEEDDAPEEALTFMHEATGLVFTATEVTEIVDEIGQRGFHREYGVPRTTVQEWLKAIAATK